MKTLRSRVMGILMTLAALGALAGCNTFNFDTEPSGLALVGKKTFTVADVYGGGGGAVTGAGGAASAAAAQAIRDIFEQHGYVYEASGAVDFQVAAAWQYNTSANPFYTQTQMGAPPATPVNLQQITLSIVVRDDKGKDILWRAETPFPITAVSLTPDGATSLVRQALKNLPVMHPGPAPAAAASKP